MISEFEVKNYKSIKDCTIELGKFNVFIGENGCGKSNILEAFALFSLATAYSKGFGISISIEELYNKGVRINNPKLTFNSFKGAKQTNGIYFKVLKDNVYKRELLTCENTDDIYSAWKRELFIDDKNEPELVSQLTKEVKDSLNLLSLTNFDNLPKHVQEFNESIYFEDIFYKLKDYLIYNIETKALRGIIKESLKQPLGINGEGLDILISTFDQKEKAQLLEYSKFISWLDDIVIDNENTLKFQGHKLGKSTSRLYFKDKFMSTKNNVFSAENANEGILHVLFYLTLFISKKTPKFFAIDNIEKSLNPKLCRNLIKELAKISKENEKQTLITTHNPAILDGLNLNDDEQRLFIVSRTDEGYTKVERIKVKPEFDNEKEPKYKLSEMWMRGYLGGIPNNF